MMALLRFSSLGLAWRLGLMGWVDCYSGALWSLAKQIYGYLIWVGRCLSDAFKGHDS